MIEEVSKRINQLINTQINFQKNNHRQLSSESTIKSFIPPLQQRKSIFSQQRNTSQYNSGNHKKTVQSQKNQFTKKKQANSIQFGNSDYQSRESYNEHQQLNCVYTNTICQTDNILFPKNTINNQNNNTHHSCLMKFQYILKSFQQKFLSKLANLEKNSQILQNRVNLLEKLQQEHQQMLIDSQGSFKPKTQLLKYYQLPQISKIIKVPQMNKIIQPKFQKKDNILSYQIQLLSERLNQKLRKIQYDQNIKKCQCINLIENIQKTQDHLLLELKYLKYLKKYQFQQIPIINK